MARRSNGINVRRLAFWLAVAAVAGLALASVDLPTAAAIRATLDLNDWVAAGALAVALVALVLAWQSWRQRAKLRREVRSLQTAVERAMRDQPPAAAPARDDPAPAPRKPALPAALPWHPIARSSSTGAGHPQAEARLAGDGLREALAAEHLTICLRPIVSLAREEPAAYDTFARIDVDQERQVDMRRLTHTGDGADAARFERMMMIGAMRAARRLDDGTVVHVAASSALLSRPDELRQVIDAASAHPRAACAIIVDLPPADAVRPGRHAEAIDALEGLGMHIGVDLGATLEPVGNDWPTRGVRIARIPVAMLLGWSRRRDVDGPGFLSLCRRSDIKVVADDADSEEAIVAVAEMGVDLVTGDRFGRPRPIRLVAAAAGQGVSGTDG